MFSGRQPARPFGFDTGRNACRPSSRATQISEFRRRPWPFSRLWAASATLRKRAMRDRDFLGEVARQPSAQNGGRCYLLEGTPHWGRIRPHEGLVAALSRTDLALVITARPEHAASWACRHRHQQTSTLATLSDEAICRLAEASVGRPLSNELGILIAEKSEGNRLMAEEIARTLRQSDRLTETAGEAGIAPVK